MTGQLSLSFAENYVPGELYVKYKPGAEKTAGEMSADTLLEKLGAIKSEPAFPVSSIRNTHSTKKISAKAASNLESLSYIKRVSFPDGFDMEYIARKLSAHPEIEYAEPVYLQELTVIPNDPFFHPDSVKVPNEPVEQEYLNFIHAPEAWDIATGDSTIVIAIIDSGTDWNHPDLLANVWTNPEEVSDDGVDNDGNKKVDDVHGWDFYGGASVGNNIVEDNDPSGVGEPHGTHTAGIAAAVTNNGIGVASLSYNVRFMPVKVGSDNGEILRFGYQGILYAASLDADIINCSWGSSFFSQTAKEVIETATSMGSIIIASAGNDNTDADYYPAAFPGVFCVGSIYINSDDEVTKSSFSNYGSYVDVSAPGSIIYSTLFDGEYGNLSGTSMAAPVVSALAALVKSKHPDWDNDRILGQIAGTSTPITNDPDGYLRGNGYINAEAAMGDSVLYIEVVNYEFSDEKSGNNDGLFRIGEQIDAAITIRNCGEDVNNLIFDISSSTGFSLPNMTSRNIGSLLHGEEISFNDISFVVSEDIPEDMKEYIRLDFKSNSSVNFQVMNFLANPSYATLMVNTIGISFDGKGHIGYVNYSANSKGSPFVVRDNTLSQAGVFNVPLLFEGGLLFGTGEERISDSVRSESQLVAEKDFNSLTPIQFITAPDSSKQEGLVVFSDEIAGETSNHVTVTLNTYEYNGEENNQYVIFAYLFKNEGSESLTNFIPGLFLDFDVPESLADNDYAFYSEEDDILVISEDSLRTDDNIYLGATVAGSIGSPWIIENASLSSDLFGIYDGFTEEEKWRSLNSEKREDNMEGFGDVSMVVASEGFDLLPGSEKQVIFILGYGIGYDDLKMQIANARNKAELLAVPVEDFQTTGRPGEFSIKPVYPNPFNGRTIVSYFLPSDTAITATVYDVLGRKVETVFKGYETSGEHSIVLNGDKLSSGIYFLSIETETGKHAFRKFTVLK
ncbi:S8 family serine peptidase [Candidatus Latescibacterota bacterium]